MLSPLRPALAGAVSLWIAATSCASPPVPPPTAVELPRPPPPPAPSAVAPAPSQTAAPDADDGRAPPDVLAKLTADQRAELDELGALCETAVFVEDGKLAVGCTCCPSRCGPREDRRPALAAADANRVSPYVRLRGAFTEKGADERLVIMDSCSCAGCMDEAYVLRPDASGTLAVRVKAAGVRAQRGCKLVHRRGQVDRPLCERLQANHGYMADSLELYDFTHAQPSADLTPSLEFVAYSDRTPGLGCTTGAFSIDRSLTSWALRDLDGDGEDDLLVELSVGDGKITQAMAEKECGSDSGSPKSHRVELRWTATPEGFKPVAKTAAELKKLAAAEKRSRDPAAQ